MKLDFNSIFIVEGRDDKQRLSKIVKDPIYVLNGFKGISSRNIKRLQNLSKNKNLILLLDPDFAGKKMSQRFKEKIPNISEINVPRSISMKGDNIGVENIKEDVLKNFLKKHLEKFNNKKIINSYTYTMDDLMQYNLSLDGSKERRAKLTESLNLKYLNSKQLLKELNQYNIPYKDFLKALQSVYSSAILFGKFCPPHKGHIDFIKKASKRCKHLTVFLCVEKTRDKKLLENSKYLQNLTNNDRLNILLDGIKELKNVSIYIFDEEGIPSYPNGWQMWTDRVFSFLKEKNIKIDVVFTNEKDDIKNYNKYFKLPSVFLDLNRNAFPVSATMIRNDYLKYKSYLSDFAISIIENRD